MWSHIGTDHWRRAKERMAATISRVKPYIGGAARLGKNKKKLAPIQTPGSRDPTSLSGLPAASFNRVSPVSRTFGFDRGTPIDRYYIEGFLFKNSHHIRGRVLEVGNNAYTLRFGGKVVQSDVLHVDNGNPLATFVGDLADSKTLPDAAFDCIILTQTLQFIFDLRAAVATLYNALKPGGVLLLTCPGISQMDQGESSTTWFWSLTEPAARRLLEERFASPAITIETLGNVFAATTFLYGFALEEIDSADLDRNDPCYPVIIAARAEKVSET